MVAINRVGQFAIALVNDSTIKIKKAKSNHKKTDFTKNLILIDVLGAAQKLGTTEDFTSEVMTYGNYFKQTFTFDFYGATAHDLMISFLALLKGQSSYDLQREKGLTFYDVTSIEDLKHLNGTTYSPRYQVTLDVGYYDILSVPTLRIDTAQIDLTYIEE